MCCLQDLNMQLYYVWFSFLFRVVVAWTDSQLAERNDEIGLTKQGQCIALPTALFCIIMLTSLLFLHTELYLGLSLYIGHRWLLFMYSKLLIAVLTLWDSRALSTHGSTHCSTRDTTLFIVRHLHACTLTMKSVSSMCSGTCLRWSLYKAATSLEQPASLVPNSIKALQYISHFSMKVS